MNRFKQKREEYLINSETNANKQLKYTEYLNDRKLPALKRPLVSLNEYDHLLDSDLELNIIKKPSGYCSNVKKNNFILLKFRLSTICFIFKDKQ
jgi:hypothetical protein